MAKGYRHILQCGKVIRSRDDSDPNFDDALAQHPCALVGRMARDFSLEGIAGAVQRMGMGTFAVRLADLEFLSPHDLSGGLSSAEIINVIRRQLSYLPGEVRIQISEGVATVRFEDAAAQAQTEARRLFDKAAKRAKSGEFQKAKDIYGRVLELDPAMADARRELAMTLFELGDMAAAKDELIDVLRLHPDDAWSYVVLGNIYVKHDRDRATAARFFTRALELKPGDPYALNSLAAVSKELGDPAKALRCFDEAIASHPEFANAWIGKAMLLQSQDQPAQAVAVLDEMFSRAELMDARSQPIFAEGRKLYVGAQQAVAEARLSDGFKALETYKADIAALSGFPVKAQSEPMPVNLSGVARMAWKHESDHHFVQLNSVLPPPDSQHVEAHELTHIRLEALARKRSRNRWFMTTAASQEVAARALAPDIRKLERQGCSGDSLARLVPKLIGGVCGCLFNAPLDMWIETLLHRDLPALRRAQFVSLHRLAGEALTATTHPEIRKITPPTIHRATVALNGAAALFLDGFTHGATAFWPHYQPLDGAALSPRLFALWQDRRDALQPGDEYDLVDAFADILGLRGWYEWKPDPGTHEVTGTSANEGTTNPDLLQQKHPAAVVHLLDALRRYAPMDVEQVRAIALEIAMLGRSGLDYADPEPKYTLRALPGENFSGHQLMCLMHAGFKRLAPEHDTGMDLDAPFLTALELFHAERGAA